MKLKSLLIAFAMVSTPVMADSLTINPSTVVIESYDEMCAFKVFVDDVAYEAEPSIVDGKCVQVVDHAPFVNAIKKSVKGKAEVSVGDDMFKRVSADKFAK